MAFLPPLAALELHHLRGFVAVVELGGVQAGADHLHIAQPAMSRKLRRLEEVLGVKLFRRVHDRIRYPYGRLRLTREGRLFYRQARTILRRFDDSLLAMRLRSPLVIAADKPRSTVYALVLPVRQAAGSDHTARIRRRLTGN